MYGLAVMIWPRWAVMWVTAFAIYAVLKLLSWATRSKLEAPAWKHADYLLAWPGMDAQAFLFASPDDVPRPRLSEWIAAWIKLGIGVVLLGVAISSLNSRNVYVAGWIGMVGIVMTLHFGAFHVLSCAWRRQGVLAVPIMNNPLAATGVSDFWSRRWNLAFRDLTHRFVVRPLRRPLGAAGAVMAGFVLSGLVHDVVISLPAGAGFGWPTLYFAMQAAGVFLERSAVGRRCGLGQGVPGRLFAWATVLGPAPLLLHRPFVEGVIVPFLGALGELS